MLCSSFSIQLRKIFIASFIYAAFLYLRLGMDVVWFKEQLLNVIEQYEFPKCLWTVLRKDYKNQNRKVGG
jgi:hypothetical protein